MNFVEKISNTRDFIEHLLILHCNNNINDNEFCLLYDLNKSKNPDITHGVYRNFAIEEKNDDECKAEFGFHRGDVCRLVGILNIPDEITC